MLLEAITPFVQPARMALIAKHAREENVIYISFFFFSFNPSNSEVLKRGMR